MPAPAHTRVTFHGAFGTPSAPVEIWQHNLSLITPTATGSPTLKAMADGCSAAWGTHLKTIYPSEIALVKVRVARVGDDGRVLRAAGGSYDQADNETVVAGTYPGTSPIRWPLQMAIAASLRTAKAGAVGKGRFFIPYPAAETISGDWRLPELQAQNLATKLAAFVSAVQVATGGQAVVASSGSAVTGDAPGLYAVTHVRVGRVPDTMRSRRSHALEGYRQASVT